MRSCAEAKARNECGSRFIVFAIWHIGLPQVPCLALPASTTELAIEQRQQIEEASIKILHWLDLIAASIIAHRNTPSYDDAKRRAGSSHGKSGLNEAELAVKMQLAKARNNFRIRTLLARQWDSKEVTHRSLLPGQFKLLQQYWRGSLAEAIARIKSTRPTAPAPAAVFRVGA